VLSPVSLQEGKFRRGRTHFPATITQAAKYPRYGHWPTLYRVRNPHRSTSPKREVEQSTRWWCYAEMRREAVLRVIYFLSYHRLYPTVTVSRRLSCCDDIRDYAPVSDYGLCTTCRVSGTHTRTPKIWEKACGHEVHDDWRMWMVTAAIMAPLISGTATNEHRRGVGIPFSLSWSPMTFPRAVGWDWPIHGLHACPVLVISVPGHGDWICTDLTECFGVYCTLLE
jgi:hypothetical protein